MNLKDLNSEESKTNVSNLKMIKLSIVKLPFEVIHTTRPDLGDGRLERFARADNVASRLFHNRLLKLTSLPHP